MNNEILVANTSSITVYSHSGPGMSARCGRISGEATGLTDPVGLALDTVNNEVMVANRDTGSVTVHSRTASGNVAPLRTISGTATGLVRPLGLTVDTISNEVVVANLGDLFNAGDDTVTVYSRTANGNVGPLRTLSAATGLRTPTSVAVATSGACPPLVFDLDFSEGEYADCFREVLGGNEITDGPDLGGTGHSAVNFNGSATQDLAERV